MTHRSLRFLGAAILTTGLLAAPAGASAAGTPITLEQRPSNVSSYEGYLAWSHYDPQAGNYQLMIAQPGGRPPAAAPIAPSAEPFDVDLGGNRSGSATAVYTRCATPPSKPGGRDTNPPRGTGCDLYRLVLETGAEEHLTKLSAPDADESQPTIWAGDIAFIRREHGKDVLRIGNTTRTGTPTNVLARGESRTAIARPQLAHSRIAYVVQKGSSQSVHVRTIRTGGVRNVYTARSGGANFAAVTRPSWNLQSSLLYWARTNIGSNAGNRFVRWSATTGRLAYALGDSRAIATSWVDTATGMLVADGFPGGGCLGNINDTPDKSVCTISTTGPLSFTARP